METFHHRMIQFDMITTDMEIPEARRDLNQHNVLWMLRNLGFKNSNHPKFSEALGMLKTFAIELRK